MTPDTLRAELDELRQRLCFAFADRSSAMTRTSALNDLHDRLGA